MMQGYEMFTGWGGMWFGPFFMFLVPILVIALIVWAVRAFGGDSSSARGAQPTPRQILDERFAKGDIDEQEYEQRRKALDR